MHEPRRLKHPTRLPRKWKMTLKVGILTKKNKILILIIGMRVKPTKGSFHKLKGNVMFLKKTSGHVISIDMHGDSRIAYFACKIFVKSSPFDRMGIIFDDFVENV